ncbi:lysophospholipid acyltransferase family protein [Brooklawnia cerclae]|uniref:1-acyl-sn-glycerol-3-phosphate acyltransferase n=1 Tax=Brooklawnia cerclae TaxID=349934 RepID=A0ABX0SF42_9ACTN|nr:lysophospholipid acyltransferase family protein [Brooklawnia cerclae]NIH57002.1 1-acyl-sn-glycerol-3-phosphate acyltransferase [Brooklawnia cerclae]
MDSGVAAPGPHYRGLLGRVNHEPANRTLAVAAVVAHRVMRLLTVTDWRQGERVPRRGPVIFVANHVSSLDPVIVGEYLAYNGRWPHFLARANLFEIPVLGAALRAAEQIPVHRGSTAAAGSLRDAEAMLDQGRAVVIYPEGTITFDPDEWPMAGHTGAARLALRTGAPVVPIGQWGANLAVPPRGIRPFRPFKRGRYPVTVICGDPVDLSEFAGRAEDRETVRPATARIMDAITAMAEQARGLSAPQGRWLPRRKARVPRDEAVV